MPRQPITFSSSVVQEHNPIGKMQPRRDPCADSEIIHEFKRYFVFAQEATEYEAKRYDNLSARLVRRE